MLFNTVEELLKYTERIKGKTFGCFDKDNVLNSMVKDKGILGKIIENGFYGYSNNNLAQADFNNLGVELKVTGYIKNKNGTISAKERLVLSKINYNEIIAEEFNFSKLLFKNKKILIIWYEYDHGKEYKDFLITDYQLYDMSNDELIIQNDFQIIKEKVISGNAHLLSEGDTSYLGACVKGVDGNDRVAQPFSDVLAKPRAFSLKQSYLTGVLRSLEFGLEVDDIEYKTIEEYVFSQIKKFVGKTQLEIYCELFKKNLSDVDEDAVPKNLSKMISDKVFGSDNELSERNALFSKVNFIIKNVPVDSEMYPLERMAFRTISHSEFAYSWNESEWKSFFEELTIVCICYEGSRDVRNGYRRLKCVKKISFNDDEIDSFGKTYNMVKSAIEAKDISLLPYPNSFKNQYLEIAPKGQKGDNAYITFFNKDKTKVCFMMNKDFIFSKLKDAFETQMESNTKIKEEYPDVHNDCLLNIKETYCSSVYEDYNVFNLYKYGVNNGLIKALADSKISIYNIYFNRDAALKSLEISINKVSTILKAVDVMIEKSDKDRNIFELFYQGLSRSLCEKIFDTGVTVSDLYSCDENIMKDRCNIGLSTIAKIRKAIEKNTILIKEMNKVIDSSVVLEKYLKENTRDSLITVFNLKNKMKKQKMYDINNFSRDFAKLVNEGKVIQNMFGVRYRYLKFKDYLNNNYDERLSSMLISRLSGETLQVLADRYGLTRERVRQICARIKIFDIPETFDEDKYEYIFKKYAWSKDIFLAIFDEEAYVYNYLLERFNVGTLDLKNILDDDFFTEKQKQIYKSSKSIAVAEDGTIIHDDKEFLKRFIMKYAQNEISVEELCEIYNDEIKLYPELNLEETNSRNLEGKLSRCDFVFAGMNRKFRFFEFDALSNELIDQLKELIILNDGFYSTEYLFRNNLKLMEELDIRNEYELHNLLRQKIDDDNNNVYFTRMPNFLVEYKDRDSFILDKIKECSPIKVDDFVDLLYEDYGHKKNYMYSLLLSNFNEYIKNGFFDIETKKFNESEIETVSSKLNKSIYSLVDIEKIFESLGFENPVEYFNNYNFSKLGYKLKSGFIISDEYTGIYNYLNYISGKKEIIRFESDLLKCGPIYNAINSFLREKMLFKMTDQVFITQNKLTELGISSLYVEGMIANINKLYSDRDYFSVNNVMSDLDLSKLLDVGLTEQFVENFVISISSVSTLRINNTKLFTLENKKLSIKNFMYEMVSKYRSVTLTQLENEIRKNYQIIIPANKLREYLYGTDIFYSDILDKIYNDSEDYYVEVYDE